MSLKGLKPSDYKETIFLVISPYYALTNCTHTSHFYKTLFHYNLCIFYETIPYTCDTESNFLMGGCSYNSPHTIHQYFSKKHD